MSQKIIKGLLEAHVETSNADVLNLPIAWPNAEFTPPQDGSWLAVDILPATNESIDIQQGTTIYRGVCQVTLTGPLATGSQVYDDVADVIASWFPNTLLLTRNGLVLSVTTPITVYQGIETEAGFVTPISFEYEAH